MQLKTVHRYVGLLLCLVMLLISLTGTLLLWKKEFLWIDVEAARDTVDVIRLPTAIDVIESNYAQDELIFIQLYSEDLAIHKAFLAGRRYAWHNQSGEQLQVWSSNGRVEDWLLDLHHRFLLGNTVGLQIAGFGGLLLMPLLIIGLMIWWRRRSTLRLGLLPRSTKRAVVMRSHGNIGAVFLAPVLVLALTGVILVYPTQARQILLDGFGERVPPIVKIVQNDSYDASQGVPTWRTMIDEVYRRFPNSRLRSITPSSTKRPSRTVAFQQEHGWHRLGKSSMKFHDDGTVVIKDELEQPLANRVFGFSYPIHAAKLGLLYKLGLTIVGLALALLCILGLISFVQRSSKHSR